MDIELGCLELIYKISSGTDFFRFIMKLLAQVQAGRHLSAYFVITLPLDYYPIISLGFAHSLLYHPVIILAEEYLKHFTCFVSLCCHCSLCHITATPLHHPTATSVKALSVAPLWGISN